MVEAERLAQQVIEEATAAAALKVFSALDEAKALHDETGIKALEPQAVYFAKLLVEEKPKKKGAKA